MKSVLDLVRGDVFTIAGSSSEYILLDIHDNRVLFNSLSGDHYESDLATLVKCEPINYITHIMLPSIKQFKAL